MKKNCLLIFGGQSSEHDVSCRSAQYIVDNIDRDLYDLILVGITKEGHWVYVENEEDLRDGSWILSDVSAVLSPDATEQKLYFVTPTGMGSVHIDVIYPELHGLYGEDGTIQGIFELNRIPYVGCGVLSSAVSMDKLYTKIIVDHLGIRQAAYVGLYRYELEHMDEAVKKVEDKLPYPVFVKPSCSGSSVGVRKAADRQELAEALTDAARYDSKILVEETIVGRELECAVLGTDRDVKASGVGEILAAADFYDFDAKYNNAESKTIIDPELPEGIAEEIREDAMKIFRGLNGFSLSRVDFFLDDKGVVFNEINTLPGFTTISMYPMLFEKTGLSKKELVQAIIDTAFLRQEH